MTTTRRGEVSPAEQDHNTPQSGPPLPEWMTEREAAAYTRFASGSLRNMRCAGRGPKYRKVGGAIRYRLRDLIDWLETGS